MWQPLSRRWLMIFYQQLLLPDPIVTFEGYIQYSSKSNNQEKVTEFYLRNSSIKSLTQLSNWDFTCLGKGAMPHEPTDEEVPQLRVSPVASMLHRCLSPIESFHEGCRYNEAACLGWNVPVWKRKPDQFEKMRLWWRLITQDGDQDYMGWRWRLRWGWRQGWRQGWGWRQRLRWRQKMANGD